MPQEHRRDVIEGLFLRLAAIYGHVWKSLYKHDELLEFNKLEWLDALAPYEESIIDKALQYCLSHWEYPPTLPQFLACCRLHSTRGQYEKYTTGSMPSSHEVAHAHLNQIRAHLNMPLRVTGESKCKY